MPQIRDICQRLEEFAPGRLAEDWDNVGLLVGDEQQSASRIMTCLTVTPASAAEAIERQVELIVTHHPLPFRPLKRLTTETTSGRLLWQLIRAGISIYSPHTAFDSAAEGINQQLARGLGLLDVRPLLPLADDPQQLGSGRFGRFERARSLAEVAGQLSEFLDIEGLKMVGEPERAIERVAVACGSAGQFLESASRAGCDLLVTGETSFHTCLEAEALGKSLLLTGHYASERFGVEHLATWLGEQFPQAEVWASRAEQDPLRWWPRASS